MQNLFRKLWSARTPVDEKWARSKMRQTGVYKNSSVPRGNNNFI